MSSTLGGTKQLRRSDRQTSCRTNRGHCRKTQTEARVGGNEDSPTTPLKHNDIHSAGVPGGERDRKDLRKHLER